MEMFSFVYAESFLECKYFLLRPKTDSGNVIYQKLCHVQTSYRIYVM